MIFNTLGYGRGHTQSLILLAILALMGFQSIVLGLMGEIAAANRRLREEIRLKLNRTDTIR